MRARGQSAASTDLQLQPVLFTKENSSPILHLDISLRSLNNVRSLALARAGISHVFSAAPELSQSGFTIGRPNPA